jgi:hypothetical protein
VRNNRSEGEDAEVLRRYGEPAWNNPVVRFLDGEGRDVLPREAGVYEPSAVARRMAQALRAAGKTAPEYLVLVAAERSGLERATFTVHCFWEGEAKLGAIPGVTRTRAGFLAAREVVEVEFDPGAMSSGDLAARAASELGADRVREGSGRAEDAPLSDRKYYLRRSPLRHVPMTATQAARVNAALAAGADAGAFLSPRQRDFAREIEGALRARADALEGLEPPESPWRWPSYEAEVRRRLAR